MIGRRSIHPALQKAASQALRKPEGGEFAPLAQLPINHSLAAKWSLSHNGLLLSDGNATALAGREAIEHFTKTAPELITMDGGVTLREVARRGVLPLSSIIDLHLASRLLGEVEREIRLDEAHLEWARLKGALSAANMEPVAELEFALIPVVARLNTTGVALQAGSQCPLGATCKLQQHVGPNGRLQCWYQQLGSVTGRITSRNPNLQGLERESPCRRCLRPTPGNKFIHADYSQQEMRILAQITGDEKLLQVFRDGKDVYSLSASLLLGKPIAGICPQERKLAKEVTLSIIFDSTAASLSKKVFQKYGVVVSIPEAASFMQKFLAVYEGVRLWRQQMASKWPTELQTALGRRRIFSAGDNLGARLSFMTQATGSDLSKTGLLNLSKRQRNEWRIVALIHDALVMEVPEAHVGEATATLTSVLAAAGREFLPDVPLVIDIKLLEHL